MKNYEQYCIPAPKQGLATHCDEWFLYMQRGPSFRTFNDYLESWKSCGPVACEDVIRDPAVLTLLIVLILGSFWTMSQYLGRAGNQIFHTIQTPRRLRTQPQVEELNILPVVQKLPRYNWKQ